MTQPAAKMEFDVAAHRVDAHGTVARSEAGD